MTLGLIVSALVLSILFVDWVYLRGHHRRALFLEILGFAVVILISIRADWFTTLAERLGIGRGVDLLIYPVLVWLFREAVLGRVRYHRQRIELTEIVRHLAIQSRIEKPPSDAKP